MAGFIFYGRLKSKRLPGKGLLRLAGDSFIRVCRDRLEASAAVERFVFATSTVDEDTPLADLAGSEGVEVFRGDPDDVLLRLDGAAEAFGIDPIITAALDSPLQLPELVDAVARALTEESYESVTTYPGAPIGTGCYGMRRSALKKAISMKSSSNTECWGAYFSETGRFRHKKIDLFEDAPELSGMRLTVDYQQDYEFCEEFYRHMLKTYGRRYSIGEFRLALMEERFRQKQQALVSLNEEGRRHFIACAADVAEDVARIRTGREGN